MNREEQYMPWLFKCQEAANENQRHFCIMVKLDSLQCQDSHLILNIKHGHKSAICLFFTSSMYTFCFDWLFIPYSRLVGEIIQHASEHFLKGSMGPESAWYQVVQQWKPLTAWGTVSIKNSTRRLTAMDFLTSIVISAVVYICIKIAAKRGGQSWKQRVPSMRRNAGKRMMTSLYFSSARYSITDLTLLQTSVLFQDINFRVAVIFNSSTDGAQMEGERERTWSLDKSWKRLLRARMAVDEGECCVQMKN